MLPTPDAIRTHLERVLGSDELSKSAAAKRLLTYLVERSLAGSEGPKEVEIAIDVFGRDAGFNGSEDSVVRVAMRGLRQKLAAFYAGPGKHDSASFDIPKGAYQIHFVPRQVETAPPTLTATPATPDQAVAMRRMPGHGTRRWQLGAAVLLALLLLSAGLNLRHWFTARQAPADPHLAVRQSELWAPIAQSARGLTFVLGDLFMFTQTDPATGRTVTVRDGQINSSDDLRAMLAGNPALAAHRGRRYSSMLQKNTVIGMFDILQVIGRSDRPTDLIMREDLRAEDLRNNDIIYIGPVSRLGPLAGDYRANSRFRFDLGSGSITDAVSGQLYAPEGTLGELHKDYALVARYPGPAGNQIMVFTSGGRNAGVLEIVRTLTSQEGIDKFMRSAAGAAPLPAAFEALVAVSGYKQTGLSAELVQLHALSDTTLASSKP